jgi:cytochrome c553
MTKLCGLAVTLTLIVLPPCLTADPARLAAQEVETALGLTPDADRGRAVYELCAVCHMPEGWGQADGTYPQIAGQHESVVIKQMADIRARNRDTPTMLPFTMTKHLSLQEIADVSAYIARIPMTPDNGLGPGDALEHGRALYEDHCAECHGDQGEGIASKHMPRIQGQHFRYLVRQFEWIRDGKRRNGDEDMIEQSRKLSDRDVIAIMDYVSRLRPPALQIAEPGWVNPDFPRFSRPASLAYDGNEGL